MDKLASTKSEKKHNNARAVCILPVMQYYSVKTVVLSEEAIPA